MQYSHFGCALRKIYLPNGKLVSVAVALAEAKPSDVECYDVE